MFGRKRIAELEAIINEKLQVISIQAEVLRDKSRTISHMGKELDYANEAMDLLSSQPVISEPITEVIPEPLAWISGEPKDTGWYFVAIKPFSPLADIQTTALFYNPAARCRWMRGEKGNAERFEREIIAYIETPEYK